MPLHEKTLNQQLQHARNSLAAWVSLMDERGIAADARRRDPKWRNLNAACSQIEARMRAVQAVTAVSEELKRRKAERAAAGETEVVTDKKTRKPKKKKAPQEQETKPPAKKAKKSPGKKKKS
jgi:hypothetical protein